jgi:hypothetical protein
LTGIVSLDITMLMSTTLTLNDDVLKMARQKAARENRRLKDVINEGLQLGLTLGQRKTSAKHTFHLKTIKGRLRPSVDLNYRDKMFDFLDGRK